MIEKKIWDFAHNFLELYKLDKEMKWKRDKILVCGSDNFYLVTFPSDNSLMQFKVEKNYRIIGKPLVYYVISDVKIGDIWLRSKFSEDKINEILYNKLTPYIRDLKLNNLGI